MSLRLDMAERELKRVKGEQSLRDASQKDKSEMIFRFV